MSISERIEKITGARPDRWVGRAFEFASSPDRRQMMMQKLLFTLKTIAGIEGTEGPIKMMEQYEEKFGIRTFHFKNELHDGYSVNISVLPPKTKTFSLETTKRDPLPTTQDILQDLSQQKPDSKFFGTSGNIRAHKTIISFTKYIPPTEMPVLGLVDQGEIRHPFVSKSPDSETNEWESGGFVLQNGELEILPFSALQERAEKPGDRHIEQTLFATNDKNYKKIARLPAYNNRPFNATLIGFFVDNDGGKHPFAAMSFYQTGVKNIFQPLDCIEKTRIKCGFSSWSACLIDTGGAFAGMINPNQEEEKLKVIGPSTFNSDGNFDPGHSRTNFLIFELPN